MLIVDDDVASVELLGHLLEDEGFEVWKAHTGTPSAQFYVPILLDAAAQGRLTLERVVELTATAPARRFGLASKGRLDVGARRPRHTVGDVAGDGVIEQHRLLRDDPDLLAEGRQTDLTDVDAIQCDASTRDIVEARQQVHQRRLA